MNEQTPTWSCPVCYRRIENWEDLIVDEFFSQMLINTPKHIDSVRVEPSGIVTIIDENPDLADEESEEEEVPEVKPEPEVTILLDDDDEEEGVASAPNNLTQTNNIPATADTLTASSYKRVHTPDTNEQSQQHLRKKTKSDVIDLTLDSEEEDDQGLREDSISIQRRDRCSSR